MEPLTKSTIRDLFDRFQQTGSVADFPRSGRFSTSSTPDRLKQQKLDLHHYRPQRLSELLDNDFERRLEFCDTMLIKFNEQLSIALPHLWSDKSLLYLNGTVCRQHDVIWDTHNSQNQL